MRIHHRGHNQPLFDGLSVTIEAGEKVGLVGISGSGKTTFVKLIQRLHDVNGGRVLIDGQDVASCSQASLRSQIAIVPQEPILFHRSLRRTSPMAGRRRRWPRSSGRRSSPMPMTSSACCPRATARWWASEASSCRAARTAAGGAGPRLPGGRADPDPGRGDLEPRLGTEALIQDATERLTHGRTTIVIAHRRPLCGRCGAS